MGDWVYGGHFRCNDRTVSKTRKKVRKVVLCYGRKVGRDLVIIHSYPLYTVYPGGMSMSASKLPVDLILPGAADLTVAFSSEPTPGKVMPANADQVAGGASLNYWILGKLKITCGFFFQS